MSVTRSQIIGRGLRIHCPNCGSPGLFKKGKWFTLNRSCTRCGLRFERDEGGFLGAISLNYGFTVICFLVPILVLYLKGILGGFAASLIAGVGAILVPMLFYRHSRSFWLMNYYLVLPQHLPANRSEPVPAGQDENS